MQKNYGGKIMAIIPNIKHYSANRETLVRFLKDSANYILDNAEDLVGDNKRVSGFEVVIKVSVDCAPTIELNRNIITAGWEEYKKQRDE